MKESMINSSWFQEEAEKCKSLANILYIIENYHNGKMSDEELSFAANLFKKDGFPLPSNRNGNLIGIALELNDWELASKFMNTGIIDSNEVIFGNDEIPSVSISQWIMSYKESNPGINISALEQLLTPFENVTM